MSMISAKEMSTRYSPLYFLATLGAGGLMVTFFMYLLFWVPHPGRTVPNFEDIMTAFQGGNVLLQGAILAAMAGIAFFGYLMIRTLIWNLNALSEFRKTEAYTALKNSNAESQLLAVPLALAMTVNGGFILGLVFVPGLWSVVEYLFPLAMIAFLAIGYYALRLMADFFGRIMTKGGFDCSKNNSFAQVLPAFSLAMVGVGLAAPAAMSTVPLVVGLSYILSSAFIIAAAMLAGFKLILGMRSMMENGANEESAPTLLILVPLVTVISIALLRQAHGLHVQFEAHTDAASTFSMLNTGLMIQLTVAALGLTVLTRFGYVAKYVTGAAKSAGSYALVCPGVALSVMTQFYLNKGLVAVGLVEKYSVAYFAITAIAIALQAAMIWLVLKLNAKHFKPEHTAGHAMPAE